jgi:protein-S-isoprenylcysteine O-methyltransferase Ste14
MKINADIVLAAVCVLAFTVRTIYELLKHAKRITPNRLSFAIILPTMMALWTSWFTLGNVDTPRLDLPDPVTYLGGAVCIAGGLLFLVALYTIRALETYEGDLMTRGIYSKIRHPMYLGFILWLVGNAAFTGAVLSCVLSVPFIAAVLFWRHLEELELLARFRGYKEYRKTTLF